MQTHECIQTHKAIKATLSTRKANNLQKQHKMVCTKCMRSCEHNSDRVDFKNNNQINGSTDIAKGVNTNTSVFPELTFYSSRFNILD